MVTIPFVDPNAQPQPNQSVLPNSTPNPATPQPVAPVSPAPMMTPLPATAKTTAPTVAAIPMTPLPTPAPSGSKSYTVAAGDSLSAIAQKFGVPISSITGYRSGDPNKIFPGETLSIGAVGAPQNTPAPQATPSPTPVPAPTSTPTTTPTPTTPATVPQAQTDIGQILKEYGFDPAAISYGFNVNPEKTVKDLVTEVMGATGLTDAKNQITTIANDLEGLANERDAEIAKINDNPFVSATTKAERIKKLTDQYEKKIDNRTRKLTLLQGVYDDARQEAQFAATTAINLYDKNRTFNQSRLEFAITQAEKQLEAKSKLHPAFELSQGQSRYEYDEKTGSYKLTASVAPKTTTPSGADIIPPGIYKTDLDALIGNVPNLISSKNGKEAFSASIAKARSDADKINAVATVVLKNSPAPIREDFVNQSVGIKQIDKALAVLNSGVQTGVLQAGQQYAYNLAGKDFDPKIAAVNAYITSAIQPYRNSVTGAAWGTQEDSEYASLFGSTKYSPNELKDRLERVKEIMKDKTANALNAQINPTGDQNLFAPPKQPQNIDDDTLRQEFAAFNSGNSGSVSFIKPINDFFSGAFSKLFQ